MILRYQCCSRSGVWRHQHSYDKDGVCILCDRTKSQAETFLRNLGHKFANIYWAKDQEEARRRQLKFRHYELSE